MNQANAHVRVREMIERELIPQANALAERAVANASAEFQMKVDRLVADFNTRIRAVPGVVEGEVKPKYENLMAQFGTHIVYQPDQGPEGA